MMIGIIAGTTISKELDQATISNAEKSPFINGRFCIVPISVPFFTKYKTYMIRHLWLNPGLGKYASFLG